MPVARLLNRQMTARVMALSASGKFREGNLMYRGLTLPRLAGCSRSLMVAVCFLATLPAFGQPSLDEEGSGDVAAPSEDGAWRSLEAGGAEAPPTPEPEARAAYRIGPGDVLEITVVGEPTLSPPTPTVTVGPDGRITFPYIGSVDASGKTVDDLSAAIRTALLERQLLLDPVVLVRVTAYNAQTVNIIGAVVRPGSFPYRPGLTVRSAIALAGGLVLTGEGVASQVSARLVRGDGTSIEVSLAQALQGIGEPGALELEPNDTLVVERRATVSVVGYVGAPGTIEVEGSVRLSELIGRAGGMTAGGDATHVRIKRASGAVDVVNLRATLDGTSDLDPFVYPGDAVFVPEARRATVLGYVERPGPYPISAGDRVTDLIAAAGGPTTMRAARGVTGEVPGRGDIQHVVLTRADGRSVTLNLTDALQRGTLTPEVNPLVEPGDTIFVPEERIEVSVLGHVVTPGRYSLRAGDRVTDALALAGGPLRPTTIPAETTSADLARCALYRATGEVITLDLSRVLTDPSSVNNLEMSPGDALLVPEARNRVSVAGYVTTPGYYEFRPGDTVRSALAMAGGVLANVGSRRDVTVRHHDGTEETLDVNRQDATLRPNDEILVAFARNRVAVLGYVAAPGLYEWHEGDTVADMIAAAGGVIVGTGDFHHAVVIRKEGEEEKLYPVDIGKFYDKGLQSANPPVFPNDVVFIPKSDHTNYSGWLENISRGLVIWNLLDGIF